MPGLTGQNLNSEYKNQLVDNRPLAGYKQLRGESQPVNGGELVLWEAAVNKLK
ncbi:MAG: hypothetical protein ACOX6Z_00020 [Dethiobacteria bacterium]